MDSRALLSADLADKLGKVLGLLGSDHDGEALAAGRRAHAMVKAAGLTWSDVVGTAPPPEEMQRRWREPTNHIEAAAICRAYPEVLTEWEAGFVASVARFRTLSPRQSARLATIVAKARAFAMAEPL